MDYMAAQMDRQIEGAISEHERLCLLLEDIADVAHAGGIAGLTEHEALCAVRKLTLSHWNKNRNEKQMMKAVICAVGRN
jgi:hypothetical protein